MKRRSLTAKSILATLASALILAASQNTGAYGQAQSGKKPTLPATAFGKLVRVEHSNTASTRVVYTKAVRIEQKKAEAGKVFVILHFVGKSSVDSDTLQQDRSIREFLPALAGSHAAVRTDPRSWLTDSKGQKYSNPYLVIVGLKRQLAFQVPADVTGLIWHDGKQAFQLEPYPVAIQESKPPGR